MSDTDPQYGFPKGVVGKVLAVVRLSVKFLV